MGFLKRLLHPSVRIHGSITLAAPLEVVSDFWRQFSNFSKFMSYVREVRVNDSGGLSWAMSGPLGIPVRWDAQVTGMVPRQEFAWESLPGAVVRNTGQVCFKELQEGVTRVTVTLTYTPVGGVLGYWAVAVLGVDPRVRFQGDLKKMKALIERDYARQRNGALAS